LGFSIGITIGGVAQIATQCAGYVAIQKYQQIKLQLERYTSNKQHDDDDDDLPVKELRRKSQVALKTHAYNMVFLFVAACGIPAGLRIADMLPVSWGIARTIGIITLLELMGKPFAESYFISKSKSNVTNDAKKK
jgi:hypothetical protein